MLPPFRVRTLRPSASPRLGRSKNKELNALIRITAPEYDKSLRVCPEATLKYLDEEDGEIVTIGSSFELIQCLESPAQQNPHYIGSIPSVSSLPSGRDFTEALAAPAVHQRIFHIDCRPSSVQLWREIEERSKEINKTLLLDKNSNGPHSTGLSGNPHGVQFTPTSIPDLCPINARSSSSMRDIMQGIVPESELKVQEDASNDLSRLQELEDYRITSIDASIRPDISQGQEAQSRNCLRNCSGDVVDVSFHPADSIPRLQELSSYGLKPHLRRDPITTDDQVGSNLKPSLKESFLPDRDEHLISKQQHDAPTSSRSAGARDHLFEFNAAIAHAPETYSRDANDKQSLLNLFEAELARVPSPSTHTKNERRKGNVHVCDKVFSMRSALKSKDQFNRLTQLNNTTLHQTPQTPAQVCIQALELGLSAALSSFHACMNEIAESVQQASAAVQSVDRSRIETAIASFRTFAQELAASAKAVEQTTLKSDIGKLDQRETIKTRNKDSTCVEFMSRKVQGGEVGGEPKRDTARVETKSFKDVAFSDFSKSSLSSQQDVPFSGGVQDGTTVYAEDRSALRRSLNKPCFVKQAFDDARNRNKPTHSTSYSRIGMQNASEAFTETVYSGEELSKATASHKVIPRFPTFRQFEDEALATVHRFPPLPSMEALEPHRLNPLPRVSRRLKTRDGSSCIEKDIDHGISALEPLGGTSVTIIPDRSESSGEFFNRMTGVGKEPVTTTYSSLPASVDQEVAGLNGELTQVGPFLGPKNVTYRQNVGEPARNDNSVNSTRRPYSENFSGEGRIGWDIFLPQGPDSLDTNLGVEPIPSSLTSERGHVLPFGIPSISYDNVHNDKAASEVQYAEIAQDSEQSSLNQRGDTAYVKKVQACASELYKLGYGSDAAQGGFERLEVYAQAAEGDLITAIDIIDEEQRAYKSGLQV